MESLEKTDEGREKRFDRRSSQWAQCLVEMLRSFEKSLLAAFELFWTCKGKRGKGGIH